VYVLGISFGIDTSAALLRDGDVVAASLEERFSRQKHDRNWPSQAIAYCLREAGIGQEDVDHIAFFWNPTLQLDFAHPGRARTYRHHGDYLHMAPSWLLSAVRGSGPRLTSPMLTQTIQLDGRRPLSVHYVAHHRAHAASAFYPSPFSEAAVLTVDGNGERAATTLGAFRGGAYESVAELDWPNSLGAVWAAVTGWLGFRPNSGEGKVMGLAPYGDDRFVDEFRAMLGVGSGRHAVDLTWFAYYLDGPDRVSQRFVDRFGPACVPGLAHTDSQRAVAFALQAATEDAMLGLARTLHGATGLPDLALAGGVAMNSVANGRIETEGPFRRVFVQPAAGDGGTAAGAALWAGHQVFGWERVPAWRNDRFGPAFDDESCRAALRRGGWGWTEPVDLVGDTAEALAAGELVGWFQGRAEYGARALGGRSILADPRDAANKDVLNARVKFREGFRPFAPSVTEEGAASLFELPAGRASDHCVPFMQKVFRVRAEARAKLGAVTHVDGTARLQTVSRDSDPLFHALIAAFGGRTGVPAVLNTSFNVRGEPIVGSPDDAIRCWATTGLDRLVLGPCVLRKPR
jgi:carbamoyltransferase